MATYTNITQDEIEEFLFPQGFQEIKLAGTREKVYAKRVDQLVMRADTILGKRPLSLRVYTGIEDGKSRKVGEDAIRVTVFWKDSAGHAGKIYMAGSSKRVHRVKGWKKNLQNRIDAWKDSLGPMCVCGAPMVERKGKNGNFYGCARYPVCTNTREI